MFIKEAIGDEGERRVKGGYANGNMTLDVTVLRLGW